MHLCKLTVEKYDRWKNTKQIGINLEQPAIDDIQKVVTSGIFTQFNESLGIDLTRNADLIRYSLTCMFSFPPTQKEMEEAMKWANTNFAFGNLLKKLLTNVKEKKSK